MAYNETYDTEDVAPIVVDGIATIGVVIVSFATLIGLILLYGYLKKHMKKL